MGWMLISMAKRAEGRGRVEGGLVTDFHRSPQLSCEVGDRGRMGMWRMDRANKWGEM